MSTATLEARNALVTEHLGMVANMVKHAFIPGAHSCVTTYDDAFQAGCLGLLKAADKWNPDYGSKFASYARVCIKRAVYEHLNQDLIAVKNPSTYKKRKLRGKRLRFACRSLYNLNKSVVDALCYKDEPVSSVKYEDLNYAMSKLTDRQQNDIRAFYFTETAKRPKSLGLSAVSQRRACALRKMSRTLFRLNNRQHYP